MTHYDTLGVEVSASLAEVRQAYVRLARRHHPDRPGGDAATMRSLNEAWGTLSDPDRREAYDRTLGPNPAPTPRVREPHTAPSDADDLLADLEDDSPIGGRVVLPRWLSLLPVAVFAASVALGLVGVLFASPPALALSFMTFAVSCAMFLGAPFVALLGSRRRQG